MCRCSSGRERRENGENSYVLKAIEKFRAQGAALRAPSPVNGMFRSGLRLLLRHPLLFPRRHLTLNPGILFGFDRWSAANSPIFRPELFFAKSLAK